MKVRDLIDDLKEFDGDLDIRIEVETVQRHDVVTVKSDIDKPRLEDGEVVVELG